MADPYKRDRRLGFWVVPGHDMFEYPGILEEIQRHVVILRAESMFTSDAMKFVGRSHDFDIAEEGDEIPRYRPVIEGGRFQRWERDG